MTDNARDRVVRAEEQLENLVNRRLPEYEADLSTTHMQLEQTQRFAAEPVHLHSSDADRELHSIQWKLRAAETRTWLPPSPSTEVPTGTVAVVFTSIQDYVQLWDAVPIAMSESLVMHNGTCT